MTTCTNNENNKMEHTQRENITSKFCHSAALSLPCSGGELAE